MVTSLPDSSQLYNKVTFLANRSQKGNYWNISRRQGQFLRELVRLHKPDRILEVGTSNGFSALWMVAGLSDVPTEFVTIEVDEGRFQEAQGHFRDLGIDWVTTLQGEVTEVLARYPFDGSFDFIFLDAAQKKYGEIFQQLVEKGCISSGALLVADNVVSHQLDGFLDQVGKRYRYQLYRLDGGLMVAQAAPGDRSPETHG